MSASWLVAGAAGFYAMHEYEKRERAEGEEVNHGFVKEMLAGVAAGEVCLKAQAVLYWMYFAWNRDCQSYELAC